MYKPLGIVFAIIMGVTLLGDTLYLGRYNFIKFLIGFGYSQLLTLPSSIVIHEINTTAH